MVMDVLIGNGDRWPGGNIHFRSMSARASVDEARGRVTLQDVRMFSLDNEAGFKGRTSLPLWDLKKYVSRFDRDLMTRLTVLRSELLGLNPETLRDPWRFLDFTLRGSSQSAVAFIVHNIGSVLAYVRQVEARCGEQTYF